MRKSGWISGLAVQLVLIFFIPMFTLGQTWGPKYTSMTWGTGGYYEYLPAGYNDAANAGKKYPVILFIHGIGEQGNGGSDLSRVRTVGFPTVINAGFFPNSFNVNGQDFSFIAIVPQFSGWPGSDQINNILDYIQANYRADEARLYLTGLSMGGGVTWDYASSSPVAANRLAAILPVCGASSASSTKTQIMADSRLPVLATHNDLDPVVTVWNTHGYVDGMNGFGVNPSAIKVIWSSAIHNAWSRTYDPYEKLTGNLNAYEWLLQHSRGSATPPPPATLSASIASSTSVSCNGSSDGSATVRASGGTAPYSYSWSTSPAQTGVTATGLAAGTYAVTVRDANNTTASVSVTINQPARVSLNVSPGSIALYGGTTNVTLSASGGTAPYAYSGPVTNVTAGTYTYSVTDANGCTDSKSVTITQPGPTPLVVLMETWQDVTCFGGNDGSVMIRVSGGIAPFTYRWNTTPVQTGVTANNLQAGTYSVEVTDASGATKSLNVNVAQPEKLNLQVTPGTISVNGGTTSVSLNASGGNAPYSFSGPTSNVSAGSYTYTVTDAKGCTDTKAIVISEPPAAQPTPPPPPPPPTPPTVSISAMNNAPCAGSSGGSATALAAGGKAPYTYHWNTSPVQTTATANGLPSGNYTVTVTDANNLSSTASVSISEPAALTLQVQPGTIANFNGSTDVFLNAAGGVAPYSFSGPTSNVVAGTYTYKVTDANGCTDSKTVSISQPPAPTPAALVLAPSSKAVSCFGGANGTATVLPETGTAPFSYSWSTSPAQTTASATGLRAGTYTVTVRDANNATGTATITVGEPAKLSLEAKSGTIDIHGGLTDVNLVPSGGTAPYVFSGTTTSLKAGTYTFTVTDANGCAESTTISISEPPPPATPAPPVVAPLTARASTTAVSCFGGSNGSAQLDITGGKTPYEVSWSGPATLSGPQVSGIAAGVYQVSIKDASQQAITLQVEIAQPQALVFNITANDIQTIGGTTQALLQASGGVAPYAFSGITTGLKAGTYQYQVTDANGCMASKELVIREVIPLTLQVTAGRITCYEGTTNVSLRYSGGVAPYKVTGDTNNVKAGNHTYIITDAAGNRTTQSIVIQQPEKLELIAIPGLIRKVGGTTSIELNAKGGTMPYSYVGEVSNLRAGQYAYNVVDVNGCKASAETEVREPAVTLSSFDALKSDTTIDLKWATSYEYAIDHFDIERSEDNLNYTLVSRVTSLWNSLRTARYVATDGRPYLKRNYYRVVAVTIYGERIFLEQRDLFYEKKGAFIVKNMPTMLDITIDNFYMEPLTLVLYDMNGKPLRMKTFEKQTYIWNTKMDLQGLPAGSYVIQAQSTKFKYAKQVVKL